MKIDNDSVQQNVQKRLNESEELREKLTDINKQIYHERVISQQELPPLEAKNYAILRNMEEQLNQSMEEAFKQKDKSRSEASSNVSILIDHQI